MSSRILKIENGFEVWGFFNNDVLVRTTKLRVRNWR